jgi:hypothetical protein
MTPTKNLFSLAMAALFLAMATPTVLATPVPIAPGNTGTSFTPTTSAFTGTLLGTYSMTFSNSSENGTVYEDVYDDSGLLDFYYQIANNASSSDSLSRVTVGNFTGYTTAVDYLLNGGDAPSNATRQAVGDSVGFNFFTNIAPGTTTNWLEVSTNATATDSNGTVAAIDSLPSVVVNAIEPAEVPEPSSFVLLGAGLLAMAGAARRKFSLR